MSFNATPFGNLDNLAAGATSIINLSTVVPNIKEIVSENLQVAVAMMSDRNRIGISTTGSSAIKEYLKTSLVGTSVYFKNPLTDAYGTNINITLYGWVEYTKTSDSASGSSAGGGSGEILSGLGFASSDSGLTAEQRLEALEADFAALSNDLTFLAEYDVATLQAKIDALNFIATADEATSSAANLLALADLIALDGDTLAFATPVRFDALATFTAGVQVSGEAAITGQTNLYGSLSLAGDATIAGILDLYRYTLPEDLAGLLTVPAGTTSASHAFTQPFTRTPIINLTPVLHGYNYYLQETTPAGFSIYVDKTRDASASFNFSTTPVR
jgi:hypothetical protein